MFEEIYSEEKHGQLSILGRSSGARVQEIRGGKTC